MFKAMSRSADLITAKFNEWRQWFIAFFFLTSAFSANDFSIFTEVPVKVAGMITSSGSGSFRSSFIEFQKLYSFFKKNNSLYSAVHDQWIMWDLCILRYAWIRTTAENWSCLFFVMLVLWVTHLLGNFWELWYVFFIFLRLAGRWRTSNKNQHYDITW